MGGWLVGWVVECLSSKPSVRLVPVDASDSTFGLHNSVSSGRMISCQILMEIEVHGYLGREWRLRSQCRVGARHGQQLEAAMSSNK